MSSTLELTRNGLRLEGFTGGNLERFMPFDPILSTMRKLSLKFSYDVAAIEEEDAPLGLEFFANPVNDVAKPDPY